VLITAGTVGDLDWAGDTVASIVNAQTQMSEIDTLIITLAQHVQQWVLQ